MTQWVKWRVVHTSTVASATVETWVPASLAHEANKVEDLPGGCFLTGPLCLCSLPSICACTHTCAHVHIHMLVSFKEGSVVSRVLKH